MKIEYSFLISINKPSFKDEDAKEFLQNLSPNLKSNFLIVNKTNTKVKIIVMSYLIEYIAVVKKQKIEYTNNAMLIKIQKSEKEIKELKQKIEIMTRLNEAINAKSKENDAFMEQIKVLNDRIIEFDNEKTKSDNEISLLKMIIKTWKIQWVLVLKEIIV